MKPDQRSESSTISAVARAFAVIRQLADAPEGITAGELSARTAISLSTVSRVLATLLKDGYVTHDDRTGFYFLSLKTLAMCYRYADRLGFPEVVMPALRALAQETGELAHLAVVQDDEMWFVAKAEGQQPIKLVSLVGRRVVLHAMAAGRAWLAYLPEEEALRLLMKEGLKPLTPLTITSLDLLRRELSNVRERGCATQVREVFDEVAAIACPVFHPVKRKRVVGALVVNGPAFRLTKEKLEGFAPAVQATVREIEKVWPTNVYLAVGVPEYGARRASGNPGATGADPAVENLRPS